MSETFTHILAYHSAPAICGIKASNLISISLSELEDIYEQINEFNSKFNPKVYIKILCKKNKRLLILIYRQKTLESCLQNALNKSFLSSLGYPNSDDINVLLTYLQNRLKESNSFPHEIGIFLGYDVEDIKGYIEGVECIYSGYWKVYSNLEEKLKLFNSYTKCRDTVCKLLNRGYSIDCFMH